MPNPKFPDIPYAPVNSYEETPEDPGIRTDMDDGSTFGRRKFTRGRLSSISLPWQMSAEHKAILLDFYLNVVGGCALSFDFVHPDPDSEFYGKTLTVYFASPPVFKKVAPGWFKTTIVLREA